MRIRYAILMLLLGLPQVGWSQATTKAFTLTDKSANSLITDGAGELKQGYARILPNSGATTPSGVAIFGFRTNDVLVTEAGVPAYYRYMKRALIVLSVLFAFNAAADQEPDPVRKKRLREAAGLLGETARGVATEVIAKVIVHAGGMG